MTHLLTKSGTNNQALTVRCASHDSRSLSVIKQVTLLQHEPLSELRRLWQDLFGTPAPKHSKKALLSPLSYRLQELAYGGLSDRHQRQLTQLATHLKKGRSLEEALKKPKTPSLVVGTRLIREYRGVSYEVLVTDQGFTYEGQPYRSLSAVANRITGVRWNGWVFFGLKKK